MSDTRSQKLFSTSIPANETERRAALYRYKILDTPPEAAFDRITRLAAQMFNVPTVLISLVDETRAWFKSCIGFDACEVQSDAALYNFATLTDDLLIIPDTRKSDRFAQNPLVQAEPGVRFYAGAPLRSHDGFNLGTLCLLDTQPREVLSPEQQTMLTDLAAMASDGLELRLAARQIAQQGVPDRIAGFGEEVTEQQAVLRDRKQAEAALRESEEKLRAVFDSIDEGFCIIEIVRDEAGAGVDYRLLEANRVFERQTGVVNARGKLASEYVSREETFWLENFDRVARTGEPARLENYHQPTKNWYTAFLMRVGGEGSDRVAIVFNDITERRRQEKVLRESEAQYRSLFTTMDQGFCIIEKVETLEGEPSDVRYLTVNPAFERHTEMHDVVGKTIREFGPDAEQRVIDIYDEVVRTGQPQQF